MNCPRCGGAVRLEQRSLSRVHLGSVEDCYVLVCVDGGCQAVAGLWVKDARTEKLVELSRQNAEAIARIDGKLEGLTSSLRQRGVIS